MVQTSAGGHCGCWPGISLAGILSLAPEFLMSFFFPFLFFFSASPVSSLQLCGLLQCGRYYPIKSLISTLLFDCSVLLSVCVQPICCRMRGKETIFFRYHHHDSLCSHLSLCVCVCVCSKAQNVAGVLRLIIQSSYILPNK